jgi:hypothetical protein
MNLDASEPPVDANRLNGWKEIASFLGKGVRTVRRRERELGLPGHRLGREGGGRVVADNESRGASLAVFANATAGPG